MQSSQDCSDFSIFPVTTIWKEVEMKYFRLTRSLAQVVCLSGVVGSEAGFSNVAVHAPECRIGHCEFGVNLDGMLEKGNSGSRTG